jgi:PAP2 superfamily
MRVRTGTSMTRHAWYRVLLIVLGVSALAVPATASAQSPTSADTIREWNLHAMNALGNPSTAPVPGAGQAPHVSVLHMAMVQGAVYDAVNSIDGGHRPYLAGLPPASDSASKKAAVATAAHHVLVGIEIPPTLPQVPRDGLDAAYAASLADVPDGAAKTGGIAAGEAAAEAMLAERANDGRFVPFTPVEGTDPGEWRLAPPQGTPPRVATDPAPWVGNVDPFLVPNVKLLRTDGPNALTSAAYAEDFNEVKEVGSLTSTTRTADQTAASIFWQDSGIAIWNRVFSALAAREDLNGADSARLLAATNLAGADGSIGCWNDKYYWNFWRPITAIREAGSDGNPATEPDPAWLPLFDPSVSVSGPPLITPGFPDHPSGHTCISGAFVHTLKAFFETDRIAFTAQSNKCPAPDPIPPTGTCPPRSFDRFSEALEEIVDARVWSGIHFRTADVQGAVLGKEVAHWLDKRYFQPVN